MSGAWAVVRRSGCLPRHDEKALALRVGAAAPGVDQPAADAPAVQVAKDAAAADAFLVADDVAVLDARHEERDLRDFLAARGVAHHVLVADHVSLSVFQVLAPDLGGGLVFHDRAAAGREAQGDDQCGSLECFHVRFLPVQLYWFWCRDSTPRVRRTQRQ
jgi:hypothetical protein